MNTTKPKPIHIFKPGRHVTMAGDIIEFSEADVAATAQAYNPALHEAPLVLGHPKTDDPAQGWVQSLLATERGLFAAPRDIEAAFAEQLGQRRYGKVSAKFYAPDAASNPVPGVWYLRHVGFLGATPPGVKGLDNPAFAASEDGCVAFQEAVEFGGWDEQTQAGLWRSLRDWFLARFGQEEADKALPPWNVDAVQQSAVQPEPRTPAFADALPISSLAHLKEPLVSPEQKAALEAESQRVKTENAQLKAQLAERDAREQQAQLAKRHQDHATFAEGLVSKGVLAPKHQAAIVAVLDLSATPDNSGKSVEFGEGDDRQPLATVIKGFLNELPKVVEFGEHATKGKVGQSTGTKGAEAAFAEKATDPGRLELHVRASELAADKGIAYEEAVRQLL
ncbi:peptidase [Neisseriaceae bacterium TC5R-5]|nr:peptidase [Neisseriaceae bacterium TC5R-5]